jgi:DNA-binding beta-propeller fold protein YncE
VQHRPVIAYVLNSVSNTVTPINTAAGNARKPIQVGQNPDAIAITPNGATAYVTNAGFHTVTPITLATGTAGKPIPVGFAPVALAVVPDGTTVYCVNATGTSIRSTTITPNGATAYVADEGPEELLFPGTVTPINLATNTTGKPIGIGIFPAGIAITP